MDVETNQPSSHELEPREPTVEDLIDLCRELNQQGARYIVVGGFAIRAGVSIPFASPRLLWRMKKPTHRAKDAPDLVFLEQWFRSRGETPPS